MIKLKVLFTLCSPRLYLCAAVLLLAGCALFEEPIELSNESTDEQYLELKEMLEQQKIEWQAQKPALERLVKNEEDLAFLIDALSKLSVIGTAPSLEQYMDGQPKLEQPTNQTVGESYQGNAGSHSEQTSATDKSTAQPANTMTSAKPGSQAEKDMATTNPLAQLADSPEQLTVLMSELQRLTQTLRYNALNPDAELETATRSNQTSYSGLLVNSKVQLSDYAGQLAGDLARFRALEGARIGVASFVEFDQSLRNTNSLGNQFAEALATKLPQYGVSVVDFKLTKHIAISAKGDLALSRDMDQLREQTDMDYILTGTLVATRRGIRINSRVVSTKDNSVLAAASTFVPKALLQQIQP